MVNKLSAVMKAGLEEYTGAKVKSIKLHPDPRVEGTWAARAVMEDNGQVIDFFVVGNQVPGMRIERLTAEECAEAIEECQFDQWPPAEGKLRFF